MPKATTKTAVRSTEPRRAASFADGEAHYRTGAYAEAEAVFQHLLKRDAKDASALRMLGLCRLRLGHPAEGLDLLDRARILAPDDPFAQLHYGLGLHAVGRNAEAAEQFRHCQSLLPADPAPYLNQAAALLALGDAAGALDAARRARRRAPKLAQPPYMVGMALLALDRLEDAADAFAAALRFDPGLADAWVNLGVIRYRRDNIEGAKVAMRRALAAQPNHRGAVANLGAFLRLTGEVEASESLFRDFLERNPDADEVRVNMAADLMQEERARDALGLLDQKRVPAEPRLARHWQMQRSLALMQLGRSAEAREALASLGEIPAELSSLVHWRQALLALAQGDNAAARRAATAMEEALQTVPDLVPEHRIMGHFDLARFWSQQREHARAFPHWAEGHRLLGRFQPFSRDAHRAFVDTAIAKFDRTRLHEGPRASNRDPAPVFIVGMPRSGTTLAEQILGAHGQCFAAGERTALGGMFNRLGGGAGAEAASAIAALDTAALDDAAAQYLAELHALAPDAQRVVDKMPGNFNFVGLISLMLPGARIIHCVRDPRDIGLSIFTFRFYGYHPYAHHLDDLGWYIGEHHRLMAHWREAVPNPITAVQLKDWVEDFDGTLRRILAFLDLPYDPACERFHEQTSRVRTVSRAQVRQPVHAGGLGRWHRFERELQPLIAELSQAGALPET